ncbi:MAG TPA: COX15/CtaA family protein [Lichenihabitans sp.]|jgi:cytochrome c oxidase assembly protein subunit 15|nr:COX15/CtaA family protein [Lichenihabitans sp.]
MVSHHDSLGMARLVPGSVEAKARSLAPVRAWLWSIAGLILTMVVVGGATRLTQSGLSITEWKPVIGIIPPLTAEAWQSAFDKYKAIPQYAQLFPDMDLAGFKAIFYWEWAHRLLGRIIGFAFAAPLLVFWLQARLTPALKPRLLVLLALGGLQGLIGWWMVKSGLSERVSVSQYRLAVHLVTASVAFSYAIWLAEGLRATRDRRIAEAQKLRATSTLIVACIFGQLGLGALVAGLHAGLIYNTWPLIDGHLVPPLADLLSQHPAWTNLFENVLTVQFDHRMMAYAILIVALLHAVDARRSAPRSPAARRASLLAGVVVAQAALGITTLLLVVPLWAALLHQAMAIIVLGTAMVHRRRLSPPERYSPLAASA